MKASAFCLCSALAASIASAAQTVPAVFDADHSGSLEREELCLFLAQRDKLKPDLNVFLNADFTVKGTVQETQDAIRANLIKRAEKQLGRFQAVARARFGHDLPYTLKEVEDLTAPASEATEEPWKLPGVLGTQDEKITVIGADRVTVRRGPIALRKTPDDWQDDLTDAAGAKLTHAKNRLTDKSTWVTQGALIFPIDRLTDRPAGESSSWHVRPSVSWNVSQVEHTRTGDAEELQLDVPFVYSANRNGSVVRNHEISFAPYFLTDFGLRGKVVGASLSYSPVIKAAGDAGIDLNLGYKPLFAGSGWLAKAALVPTLDYNHLVTDSRFIERDDHPDYFRGGGGVQLGFKTERKPALEISGAYKGFWRLQNAGPNHSELLTVSGKLWFNDNFGVTLEHQKGSTPVADKDVDLTTLGLEVRY